MSFHFDNSIFHESWSQPQGRSERIRVSQRRPEFTTCGPRWRGRRRCCWSGPGARSCASPAGRRATGCSPGPPSAWSPSSDPPAPVWQEWLLLASWQTLLFWQKSPEEVARWKKSTWRQGWIFWKGPVNSQLYFRTIQNYYSKEWNDFEKKNKRFEQKIDFLPGTLISWKLLFIFP